jgi:dCTP deaminase
MILSNVEVQRALDEGRLVIEPQPQPRTPKPGVNCPYDTHSVDLRLGNQIVIPRGGPFNFDLTRSGSIAQFISDNSEKIELWEGHSYQLEPGRFVLANTLERVELRIPTDGDVCLAARIEGKSSRARLGLLIHFTAPTVHPGFAGNLTLEMINLGVAPIVLSLGMPIAQLIVEEVKGIPFSNPSQFQGQSKPSGVVKG